MDRICLAMSTDAAGFAPVATLLASILRRTEAALHVHCWCRGFLPESFEEGKLRVEFIAAEEEVTGRFPGYVGPAVFDRLRVIRDCPDWDRCLVLDYDHLALTDIWPLFATDLGEALIGARLQGAGIDMAYAMREYVKQPMPEGWEYVAEYPYFLMGILLNLKGMREAGTWEIFLKAHAAFGVDEQLSLTAASGGRTLGYDRRWNLFPKMDGLGDEVPDGIIHWSGWPKPWHPKAEVWRADIWEAEQCSWEHLRMGIWEKPMGLEVEPDDESAVLALVKRGWKLQVFRSVSENAAGSSMPGFPDLVEKGREGFAEAVVEADCVRISQWVDAADWLGDCKELQEYLVLRGALDAEEVKRVRALGYRSECLLKPFDWPQGGPLPRVLDYGPSDGERALAADEELYLRIGSSWEERV